MEGERLDREGVEVPLPSEVREVSLEDRLQALVQSVKDFVRGREVETPERSDELGR
jgi:hypothetical protein